MSAFIFSNRLYLLSNDANKRTKPSSHVMKLVKTSRGLLVMTSFENLKFMNNDTQPGPYPFTGMSNYSNLQYTGAGLGSLGFFVFNKSGGFIEKHDGVGKSIRINRDQLNDLGLVTLFVNQELEQFLEICVSEPELGIRGFYESMANMNPGCNTEEFKANAEGVSIDDLFNHPYATVDRQFFSRVTQNNFINSFEPIRSPYQTQFKDSRLQAPNHEVVSQFFQKPLEQWETQNNANAFKTQPETQQQQQENFDNSNNDQPNPDSKNLLTKFL